MHELKLGGQPLNLDFTLSCGQTFRWRKKPDGTWRGVVRDKLVALKLDGDRLLWRTYPEDDSILVRDYLRLSDDVISVYKHLSEADPHMAELIGKFRGLRLLRQDPSETLLTFVCSSANSIPRITAAIEALAEHYGNLVCEINPPQAGHYTFPAIEAVANAAPKLFEDTRLLGYRDAKLREVASQVMARGPDWLPSLRNVTYAQAHDGLLSIRGVGTKIADCVCLFALDKDEAVPVDTHVWQLVKRLWMPDLNAKSLTSSVRAGIKAEFTRRYGTLAGWAQQFLFYEDLLRTRGLGG